MLGNDIIDLNFAKIESNWRRKNYLDKIFTADERMNILTSNNPDLMVWLLWSMKESAYKIVNRLTGKRLYNPKAFSCKNINFTDDSLTGSVLYDEEKFLIRSEIRNDFIHSTAVSPQVFLEKITINFYQNKSNYVQEFNEAQQVYHLQKNNQGLPELLNLRSNTKHLTSISHHGKHLAIAFI
ncbi:4'-phosphopantetheinyl transferase superfamily protein [Pedobacter fastidiosus]|uniref:4-phosphopantetheinyl transferase family protein n=1 Tax=Pedobacter fastidiosus TaxID=2765361 RepID=A0ABR7KU29_9SPHI|nr:4'-phosphopantetheinyl transferase superfamily protein [Pedobacter fastidiosus]MBC6111611.1 4-phosphopantetheinyl transferase family protein [Pedobacter fastidiosus]